MVPEGRVGLVVVAFASILVRILSHRLSKRKRGTHRLLILIEVYTFSLVTMDLLALNFAHDR